MFIVNFSSGRSSIALALVLAAVPLLPGPAQALPLRLSIPDVNGGRHLIPDTKAQATALVFIAHDCPISCALLPEVERVRRSFPQIPFYVVYAEPNYSRKEARRHARQYGIGSVCLTDQWAHLVRWTGATVTPEAVLLNSRGTVLYAGRVDNLYAGLGVYRTAATTHDLRDALEAVVRGHRPPRATAPAAGCTIEIMAERGNG